MNTKLFELGIKNQVNDKSKVIIVNYEMFSKDKDVPVIQKQKESVSKTKEVVKPIVEKKIPDVKTKTKEVVKPIVEKKIPDVKIIKKENPMRIIKIAKVVLNIGVGESGEIIERAKTLLQDLTGHMPSSRNAERTVKEFGIHKGEPIGVTVTLRGPITSNVVKRFISAKSNKISKHSFDRTGNCSFGIREHIEIPDVKYDPNIGIFGMDISVILERPGTRVMRRKRIKSKVGITQKVSRDEAIDFFKTKLNIEVV
ncbi:50S ribosomal protein L5 [Thermoproteota archaeon]